jgi:hypothetical protein
VKSGDLTGGLQGPAKDSNKDPFDMMTLGAAVPTPDEPLDAIALTRQQNSCSL